MKKIIKLNEEKLNRIIKEAVNAVSNRSTKGDLIQIEQTLSSIIKLL